MATETLDHTIPPLQDKTEDNQSNENDAAGEPQPIEEETEVAEHDAGIPEKDTSPDVAESKEENLDEDNQNTEEKKEIDEHSEKEEEKDDGDEDEDEDAGEDEDEEEEDADEKGKATKSDQNKLKKDAGSEKKSPATPSSDRPTRERKTVERYSAPSPSKLGKSSSSKGLTIEKGRGTQLKDIPNVAFKLSKRKPDDNLHVLHSLLFGKKTKAHNLKRNIGQFSGYVWVENEEKQRAKIKERIDKCVKEKLMDFCDVLNIPIIKSNVKKEDISAKLLEFLESPHATTDVLLSEKEQKGKKRTRKATPGKSPVEASTETPSKKQKQTPVSGKKQKPSSDVEEVDKAELSDAKDESQEDEDVVMENNDSDDEVSKSEEEEDTPKAPKSTTKKTVKEGSGAKAGAKTPSVKKTSTKAAKSSEKTPKKSIQKQSNTEHDNASVSLSKSKQRATKKQKVVKEKQDTGGKAASKTSKASVKDQVKGKSSKKAKVEPSREEMHTVVVDILKEVDFNTATLSDILRQLGTHFGLDLMHRKAEVKDIITDVINNMSDEEEEGEEAENDGDGDVDAGKDGDDSDEDDDA